MIHQDSNQILWKCRRGMLELDLIFTKFYQEQYPLLSVYEQKNFEQLLDELDPVLFSWIFGTEIPADSDLAKLVQRLKQVNIR